MTKRNSGESVVAEIAAPPDHVYDLISDVTRMGERSPECVHCEWADGATGPAVGARFKARNKAARGPAWFNKPEVTVADPGREFAFNRKGLGIDSYAWRYRLEPIANGTRVTESYEVERPVLKAMNWLTEKWTGSTDRDADLRTGMQTTLSRLKAAAEAG